MVMELRTIPQMFYKTVERFPHRLALTSVELQLTYQELNERSNQVAHMLIAQGLKKGDFVSLVMERSIEIVITLLGVLKAGGVYVPIDPTYPKERCRYLITDTKSSIIFTKKKYETFLAEILEDNFKQHKLIFTDDSMDGYAKKNIFIDLDPSDLAYVIYTSGSTGRPKGTMLAHEGVINVVNSMANLYESTENDIYTQYFSISFDPSVLETFLTFYTGAQLHMLSEIERISIETFADAVERVKATVVCVPTTFFNQLAVHLPDSSVNQFKSMRYISTGGEALIGSMVQRWQRKFGLPIPVVNLYGPTECTVVATANKVTHIVSDHETNIPIGQPLANYEAFVVNDDGQICPVNVPGELHIGGIGLAKGYLNQPEKTAEAFIPHLFSKDKNRRLYKTGDIVRLLPNGMVEYVGRKDSQVKVRGYRIEIGEIEDQISRIPYIAESAIIPRRMADGNNRLIAYFTVKNDASVSLDDIRQYLGNQLPSYMVPEQLIQLDKMPLTPNGKIDRNLLALREDKLTVSQNYIAPINETQTILAQAWEKVLGLEQVGIYDDFFHSGGHSLKILQILVQVKKEVPFLKIQDFYQYRTIAELDQYIRNAKSTDFQNTKSIDIYEVKDLGEPPALMIPKDTSQSRPMNAVLLTGSTGYLGSHVLYELLEKTIAQIYCLIRNNSNQTIAKKLTESMQFYFGEKIVQRLHTRVTVVEGDLSQKDLHLSLETRQMLIDEIDAIIHCGADVRHFGDADHFHQVNVEGTRYLVELAKHKKGVHFHHVSTIGIPEELASSGQWEQYTATGDFDYTVHLENVYTQSKLQAENIVRDALSEKVPITIYRVGNLTSHSKTGHFQRNMDDNAFYRMIKAMLYLGKAPKANWYVDMTPVDYASQALVTLARSNHKNGQTYHLCNPNQLEYTSFIQMIQELGYSITLMDQDEYQDWLLRSDHPEEVQEYLSLAIAQLEGEGAKDSEYRFVCKNTVQHLQNSDIRCAEPNKDLIQILVDYGVQRGYFPDRKSLVINKS